ncbi:MAG: T9SS type A sorting domain-containing protein, partial [Ignavibacteria bacterium]|nr:T9SS type A sorting domain-containing protein [Ignavibacteria bacterium]
SKTTNWLRGVFFTDANTGTAVGENGTILRTTNGGVYVKQINSKIPERFSLYQNYPNPFNSVTKIKFDIHQSSNIKLVVYDILGKEIATLVNEKLNAGSYEVNWNASNYASGVYFCRLTTEDYTNVKKMLLIK